MVLIARSEIIIPVTVNSLQLENQQIVILVQDINKSVSCGNVLNNIKHQQILVSVINTSEEYFSMEIPQLQHL